jgi:thymidylate synthase (FAD)
MKVKYIHSTLDGDGLIASIARVSNPKNQDNRETAPRLIKYCATHGHWSVFEMASLCVEINTTRDIGRQILRHRSFSFQEFSQRYQDVSELPPLEVFRETRLQDAKNRQGSTISDDEELQKWFERQQFDIWSYTNKKYKEALEKGIAKEQARCILPEGLTPTRMYMNGTVRSWIHFLQARLYSGAQKEIREIAEEVEKIIKSIYPETYDAIKDYIRESR